MVGLIQILTYLLCVYLVFKGVEIFQIALMSSRPNRVAGLVIGVVAVFFAVLLAISFAMWTEEVAKSIGERVNELPLESSSPLNR